MPERLRQLYVDLSDDTAALPAPTALAAADGFVLSSPVAPEGLELAGKAIMLRDVTPAEDTDAGDDPVMRPLARICSAGLEECARLRAAYPREAWIARVNVVRTPRAYHFPTSHYCESFRTFQPVLSGQSAYRVDDGNLALSTWLQRAAGLGFGAVWLHAPGAVEAGKGLDLDLREEVLEGWGGHLWLSGGAANIMHIKYLVQEGGVDALIVPPDLAASLGCDDIAAALRYDIEERRQPTGQIAGAAPSDLPPVG